MKKENNKAPENEKIVILTALAFLLAIVLLIKRLIGATKDKVPRVTKVNIQKNKFLSQHTPKNDGFYSSRTNRPQKSHVKLLLALNSLVLCIALSFIAIRSQSSRNYSQVMNAPNNEFSVGVNTQTENEFSPDKFQITSINVQVVDNKNLFDIATSDLFPFAKQFFPSTITPLKINIEWKGSFSNDWNLGIVLPWSLCSPNRQVETEKLCSINNGNFLESASYSCYNDGHFSYGILMPTLGSDIVLPHVQIPIYSSELVYDSDSGAFVVSPHKNEIGTESKSALILPGDWLAPCSGGSGSVSIDFLVKEDVISHSSFSESFMKIEYRTRGWEDILSSMFSDKPDKFILQLNDSVQIGKFSLVKPDEITLRMLSSYLSPLSTGENIKFSQNPTGLEYTFQPNQSVLIEFKD